MLGHPLVHSIQWQQGPLASVCTFPSESAPFAHTKHPHSPLPQPHRGTGRIVGSPGASSICKVSGSKFSLRWAGFLQITVSVFQRIFLFFSFPSLRHIIKTSLFEESLVENTSRVGPDVAGGQLQSCYEQGGSAGLRWAACFQLPSGRGVIPVPQWEVGKLNPGPWSVSTWEADLPGQQGHFWVFLILCTVCLTLQSLSSASSAMLCEAQGHGAGGQAGRVPHTCCSL